MHPLRFVWAFVGPLWIGLLACGWYALTRHEVTPGAMGRVPERWPADSGLSFDPHRPLLVLFAHRNCPCTRATLHELEHILRQADAKARVVVVLVSPEEANADRVGAGIEEWARSLAGVEVALDPDGIEARRFRVRTSGHVLLYGADGRLLFSGGITEARGHAGESVGRQAILARLRDGVSTQKSVPVFGCPLFANDGEE